MTFIEALKAHIRKKIKGIAYTHVNLARLMKKTMKKNGHNYVIIAKKYELREEEVIAMCSGRFYYNGKWYEVISDYTGVSIKELTRIKSTIFYKRWKKKCNIIDEI